MTAKIDPRTLRAAAMAELFTTGTILAMGLFLGFSLVPVLITGAVLGTLMAGMIIAASARADTFSPTDQTAHLHLDAEDSDRGGDTDNGTEVNRG